MPEHDYSVAGRILRLETSGELAHQLTDAFMQSCRFTRAEPGAGAAATAIHVHSDCDVPAVPDVGCVQPLPPGRWRVTPTEHYFEVGGSLVRVRPDGHPPIDLWIGKSREACRRRSLLYLMGHAVHSALRRCALYTFHGAGLSLHDGSSGLVIAGASGSGKSTLALRLVQSGWRYLSDDSVLLFERADDVMAAGLRRPFAIGDGTTAALEWPELRAALGPHLLDDPHKRWLYPDDLFPGQAAASMRPDAIVFPTRTGDSRTLLAEMRPADALARLVQSRFWAGGHDAADAHGYLRILGRLARQAHAYELMAGTDLVEQPGRASDVLRSLLEA